MEGEKNKIFHNVNVKCEREANTFVPISGWQDLIIAQLSEMFGDVVTSDVIRNVCFTCDWQVEECVEQLINVRGKTDIKPPETEVDAHLIKNDNSLQELPLVNIEKIKKHLGAIPKSAPCSTSQFTPICSNDQGQCVQPNPQSFSDMISQGTMDFIDLHKNATSVKVKKCGHEEQVKKIIENINAGYKVMVIMRGPPGSGKSFLARKIIDETVNGDYRNHIFSTDNYFYNVNNQYIYQADRLPEAHEFNQKCVRKRTADGWSPIVVDNTNIKIWEMGSYVNAAVRNGYILEILMPQNDWCNSAGKLASKNSHNVSKEIIERMLLTFEPVTVDELLKINNEGYTMKIPQFRHNPPLPYNSNLGNTVNDFFNYYSRSLDSKIVQNSFDITSPNDDNNNQEALRINMQKMHIVDEKIVETRKKEDIQEEWTQQKDCVEDNNSTEKETSSRPKPKPRRQVKIKKDNILGKETHNDKIDHELTTNPSETDWKTYEEESSQFWNQNDYQEELDSTLQMEPKPQRQPSKFIEQKDEILSILKNEVKGFAIVQEEVSVASVLERHSLGCSNENKSFVLLRQICPNKQIDSLWDLFEKCNGDINWTMEILLKDDSGEDFEEHSYPDLNLFECNCGKNVDSTETDAPQENIGKQNSEMKEKKNLKPKSRKEKLPLSEEMVEAKRAIEKHFVLGDEHYSQHLKKIRDLRHGNVTESITSADIAEIDTSSSLADEVFNTDDPTIEEVGDATICEGSIDEDAYSDNEDGEMLELNLGVELIEQLEVYFGTDTMKYNIEDCKTAVFMPKSLGKQLYAVWMESVYNQMEEQKIKRIKEDEDFARVLAAQQKFDKYSKSPNTLNEVLDMENAWNIYKNDEKNWRDKAPNDLASQLSRSKLCEIFPVVDKDTLEEIYAAHGNKFADTVEILKDSINFGVDDMAKNKAIELFKKAKTEVEKEDASKADENLNDCKQDESTTSRSFVEKILAPEDQKRAALRGFEESRNMATHHNQLRGECYQKAKDAIQNGMTAVAVYYSQIASLHKTKIDMYNQKAANSIMEVNDLTQNNPDFIDLHYLHVNEAVQCLDIFIDKHITKMRNTKRFYKYIFIITGRGLHSARGVSAIKNRVKLRLKSRNLKWSEVNPGLLKVKIFSTSKHLKNL